jgi:hypothetical protein
VVAFCIHRKFFRSVQPVPHKSQFREVMADALNVNPPRSPKQKIGKRKELGSYSRRSIA